MNSVCKHPKSQTYSAFVQVHLCCHEEETRRREVEITWAGREGKTARVSLRHVWRAPLSLPLPQPFCLSRPHEVPSLQPLSILSSPLLISTQSHGSSLLIYTPYSHTQHQEKCPFSPRITATVMAITRQNASPSTNCTTAKRQSAHHYPNRTPDTLWPSIGRIP